MAVESVLSYGNDALTASKTRAANAENFNVGVSGRSLREPKRIVYIYSVARKTFRKTHPLFPKLKLEGCENGERYVRCTSIPDPVYQVCPDQERGGTRIDEVDGWMVAIDILNPGNFTFNQYQGDSNPNFYANTTGTNFIAEGVFASLNETPTEVELKKAEDARDKHYRYLSKEALRLYAIGAKQGNEFLQRYPDTHIAMDALGLEAGWHQANIVKATCPNCGDSIKPGIAFHKSTATDMICVLVPERAYRGGAISLDRYTELTATDEEDEVAPRRRGRPKASTV